MRYISVAGPFEGLDLEAASFHFIHWGMDGGWGTGSVLAWPSEGWFMTAF